MKITKKSFMQDMASNTSIFCGTIKKLLNKDECFCAIADFLRPDIILEKRTCKTRSNSLVFSGNNILDFSQVGKYEFYKYDYNKNIVYICVHKYWDEFDKIERIKAMYYLVN